ncbi:DUF2637 domain-containing protein [Streptomyces sp. VNUA116]|uniref:DUF2637 domain-containing protein n=1 Tax=Streptomyces sp. VNUA116 TaxID=3062449 RepID=UPI002676E81F|nr:DUF2637 domain-containing protein [Streptomyces sp. VNUA116]WKU45983.1 DUF2637 domain-containing protein [Streptomyces sp. VNUA116]
MATHNPIAGAPAVPNRLSWAPLGAAVVATGLFAALAFRLSFASLTALAVEHGVAADIVWMFAVLVDGGALVGTVGVIAARRAGRPTAAYWLTTIAFALTSLCFNIAHSDGTGAGIAIAVVPPVAQLVATELLVRMLPTADAVAVAVAVEDVAPAVTAATDAARRAQDAADAARTAADAAQAIAESAVVTVADAVAAAQADTRDAVADAVERTVEAAAVAADAAARAEQSAATVAAAAAQPLAVVDLAAAVAAVDEPPAVAAAPAAVPAPLPMAAVFTAPPLPTPSPLDDALDNDAQDDALAPAAGAPAEAVVAYRRLRKEKGKRPTAEALGAALGVKRTRGSELRAAVERSLGIAAVINP